MPPSKTNKLLASLLSVVGLEQEDLLTQRLAQGRRSVDGPAQLSSLTNVWMNMLHTSVNQDRKTRYADYEQMDSYSDITKALDLYATEATPTSEETDTVVTVRCSDAASLKLVEELFSKLSIETKIFGLARAVAKYGDYFMYPTIGEDGQISGVEYFPPQYVSRVEEHGKLIGFNCDLMQVTGSSPLYNQSSTGNSYMLNEPDGSEGRKLFEPWEFIHFRTEGSDLHTNYGHSMIEGARHSWKSLEMLETALAIYRLHRSGQRFVYYIDTGNSGPDQQRDIVDRWKRSLKTKSYIQVKEGTNELGSVAHGTSGFAELMSQYNPLSLLEDVFWPVREGSTNSKVEMLGSTVDIRAIADVDHFKTKLRTALSVPKAFFDGEITGWNANLALAQQDIQFAKLVERLQRAIIQGLTHLAYIHLALGGEEDALSIDLEIEIPLASNLLELQRLQVLGQRQSIAINMMNAATIFGFDKEKWADYVLSTVMGFDKRFIKKYRTEEPLQVVAGAKPGASGVPGKEAEEVGPAAMSNMDDAMKLQSRIRKTARLAKSEGVLEWLRAARQTNPDGFLLESPGTT